MLTIGSVITYSDLQSEIERVLSIQDKKMRDISIACLIRHAEKHYETCRPFEKADVYLVSIEDLCSQFRSSFLEAYFKMQVFYWKLDLNAPSGRVLRKFEPFHLIVENPLKPDDIAALMPHLNNTEKKNEESRVEIFTNILFSHLGNGNSKELHELLTDYDTYFGRSLFSVFLTVAAASPKALKINLEQVCLYVPAGAADKFIYCCLDRLNWLELSETLDFVEGMANHRLKPLIRYLLGLYMAKTKIP